VAEPPTPDRDLGFYFALAQTGLEMAAPVALGAYLDSTFGWSPWATAAGAVLGLAGGLTHMVFMLKRNEDRRPPQPPRGTT
jgi:predicted Kef-type K+ transport protein